MKGNSDKADAIRGALWFVDHDPDVCIDRDEQNARIATYLSQHAHFCYFGRSFKSKHLKPMTVERFRAVMLGIAANTKDRDHDVHGVDVLWKAKSQGLTDDFLAKYEYDKETFDEADLPGPPSGGSQDNIILHPIVPVVTERRITEPSGSAGAQLMTRYHSGLINEVPARRSKLIAILDVEKSIATDSRKYVDHSTRLRALRLLIEQYKLTYWNRSTGLITELRPEQLIKSLRNSFDVGKITTMTDFWSFGCASERSRLRDSKPDIRQYEAQKGLAEYGSLTFVHSSEDIEEALLNIAKSVVEDGVLSEEAAPSAVEWTLNGVDLPLPKLGVCLSSIAQLLAIQDIDRSKVDCDQEYYRYIDRSHQLEALSRITTDHSLQRWDKSKWAIVGLSAEKLHEMLIGLFYRRSSERKKIHFAEIWSKGSPAFGVETMSWLHNRASQLKIYSDIVEPNISETQPPSAKMEEIRSEEDDASADARHSRGQRILSATSDDPPSRHSRKRKAREIEPDTCSISTASGNEHDSDFLPSRPAPSKRIDEAKPRTSLRHGYANFPPMHLTKARPLDRESAATVRRSHMLSNCGDLNEVAPKLASCTLPKARTLSQDIDLRRLFSDVADIASSIQHAVNTLFGSLHLDVVLPSPIPKSSGEALIALFRKCWGESWSSACGRMAASRMCSAINVLKALIAAFLFENIFRGDVSWQAEIFKDFALPVPDQQESLDVIYDLASMVPERLHAAQSKARALLARGILKSELPVLRLHANKLAENFMLLIHTHLAELAHLAQLHNPKSSQPDTVMLEEELRDNLAHIIEKACTLKLCLTHLNSGHKFFWPAPDASFDPVDMESVYPLHDNGDRSVGFTVFPGLSVDIGDQSHLVRPAHTVTRVSDAHDSNHPDLGRGSFPGRRSSRSR